jgi:hypothetical protein
LRFGSKASRNSQTGNTTGRTAPAGNPAAEPKPHPTKNFLKNWKFRSFSKSENFQAEKYFMKKISVLAAMFLLAATAFAADLTVSVTATPAIIRTSASTVSLHGTAAGTAGVAKVTWQTSKGAKGTACGTSTWEAAIPVTAGTTMIIVKAYDASGASAWTELVAVSSAAELPRQPEL